jgi:hypothetical protein
MGQGEEKKNQNGQVGFSFLFNLPFDRASTVRSIPTRAGRPGPTDESPGTTNDYRDPCPSIIIDN